MRIVVPSSEVAHLWAHQLQDEARNAGGAFYFNKETIYSYGSHFKIAVHYDFSQHIVMYNSSSYSNSTAKHQGEVSYAIPSYWTIYRVPKLFKKTDDEYIKRECNKANVAYLIDVIETAALSQVKARSVDYSGEIQHGIKKLKEYLECFSAEEYVPEDKKYLLTPEWETKALESAESLRVIEKARNKERSIERKERDRIEREEKQKDIEEWLAGEHGITYIRSHTEGLTLLRTKGVDYKVIQTSLGIEVEYEEGKRLFEMLLSLRTERVTKNLHEIVVAGYNLNSLSSDGVLKAGCHNIKWDEIVRFAKSQNWQTNEW